MYKEVCEEKRENLKEKLLFFNLSDKNSAILFER
jgi:hypothetical protein